MAKGPDSTTTTSTTNSSTSNTGKGSNTVVENNNRTTVDSSRVVTPEKNTSAPTPPSADKTVADQPSTEEKSSPTQQSQGPVLKITQGMSKRERLNVLQEISNQSVLTIDQRDEMEKLQNDPEINDSADGTSEQDYDDNVKKDRPKNKPFSESDVIKYMYEQWLIKGVETAADYTELGIGTLYERARREVLKDIKKEELRNENFEKSGTNKNLNAVEDIHHEKSKDIERKSAEKIKEVGELSSLLVNGELFEDKNANKKKAFQEYLNNMEGINPDEYMKNLEVVSKMYNLKTQALQDAKTRYDKEKAEADKIVNSDIRNRELDRIERDLTKVYLNTQAIREVMVKEAVNFSSRNIASIQYDTKRDLTALHIAKAQVLGDIANSPDGLKNVNINEKLSNYEATNKESIYETTKEEKSSYIDKIQKDHKKQVAKAIETEKAIYVPDTTELKIDIVRERSILAYEEQQNNIIAGYAAELDKKPRENKNLEKVFDQLTAFKGDKIFKESEKEKEEENKQTKPEDKSKEDTKPSKTEKEGLETAANPPEGLKDLEAGKTSIEKLISENRQRLLQHNNSNVPSRVKKILEGINARREQDANKDKETQTANPKDNDMADKNKSENTPTDKTQTDKTQADKSQTEINPAEIDKIVKNDKTSKLPPLTNSGGRA